MRNVKKQRTVAGKHTGAQQKEMDKKDRREIKKQQIKDEKKAKKMQKRLEKANIMEVEE